MRSSGSSAASPVQASGDLQVIGGGGSVGLSGTYEDSTREVTLSGGGFTFSGGVSEDGAELSGTFSDPGSARGTFVTRNASATTVTTYLLRHVLWQLVGHFQHGRERRTRLGCLLRQ